MPTRDDGLVFARSKAAIGAGAAMKEIERRTAGPREAGQPDVLCSTSFV
jgi:hypothetical protein